MKNMMRNFLISIGLLALTGQLGAMQPPLKDSKQSTQRGRTRIEKAITATSMSEHSPQMQKPSPFDTIPNEILQKIVTYAADRQNNAIALAKVSQRFRTVCLNNKFIDQWLKHFLGSEASLQAMSLRYGCFLLYHQAMSASLDNCPLLNVAIGDGNYRNFVRLLSQFPLQLKAQYPDYVQRAWQDLREWQVFYSNRTKKVTREDEAPFMINEYHQFYGPFELALRAHEKQVHRSQVKNQFEK